MLVVTSCAPSLFRSVIVTFTVEPFGFTIATPRFLESRPLLSMKRMALVVRAAGSTPACEAPPSAPLPRKPNVSKTTSPVPAPPVGVITA